ncbi:hypothetical protein KO507_12480 [Gilvimarinus agarilyticus]|uniref:hypothetical protein n=1 Tax=Gilvimarinus sp. 2_MG-2023 TaxID=3062666 RepID=UPI001C083C38|nr:hypothetical protein [Gilvimarinus sp. 2_MG-2023]MBU2886580.1 hypothetical protein [Gilvimarinus agarilyticus]MDO6571248.1 hypothetical protein [Gilvimarinus sp. 2_MG-2023]
MRPTHYLAIAIRIFSILLLLYSVPQFSLLVGVATGGSNHIDLPLAFVFTTTAAPLLAALCFWFFPLKLAKLIVKPEIDQPIEAMDVLSILTTVLLAMAVYFLYYAIVDAVYWATLWLIAERSLDPFYLDADNKANMVATALELLFSGLLLLKAKTLARKVLRIAQ